MRAGRYAATGAFALVLVSWAHQAVAQNNIPSGLVPARRVTDARGVDLVGGSMAWPMPLVSFGEHATALSAWIDVGSTGGERGGVLVINDFLQLAGSMIGAHLFPQAYFTGADGSPDEFGPYENFVFPNGAGFALQMTSYNSWSIHTNPDGSRYSQSFGPSHFTRFEASDQTRTGINNASGDRGIIDTSQPYLSLFERIILANGEEWRFYREYLAVPCVPLGNVVCQDPTQTINRLRFLTSSRGYGIQFLYQSDEPPANNRLGGIWGAPRRVTTYNKAVTYCDESQLQECPAVTALPSAEISYDDVAHTVTVRQPGATDGFQLMFSQVNGYWIPLSYRHTAVPNSTVTIQVAIDNAGIGYISRVTDSDGQWNYNRITYVDDSGRIPLMAAGSMNPQGEGVSIFGYGIFGTIQTFTNELGSMYLYSDGFPFRDNGRSEPEGDETFVNRDLRNNIISIVRSPKPGGGQPVTVYQASYPVDCINPRTCNHPTSTTDANNHTTDYTYAPEHGGTLTETRPSVNGIRPQTRYSYVQRYAWISNGAGGYVQESAPIWLLATESRCMTGAAHPSGAGCALPNDEQLTTYDYGPDSGPNNLLLRGVTVSGPGISARTCYGYDALGRRISETGPGAGLTSCP